MKFLLTLWDEQTDEDWTDEQMEAELNRYWAYDKAAQEAGVLVDGAALEPAASARTVAVRNGAPKVTDGPFAETREQLGGYYLLDCPDMDAALEWAARIPAAETGRVEVRALIDFGDPPAEDA